MSEVVDVALVTALPLVTMGGASAIDELEPHLRARICA